MITVATNEFCLEMRGLSTDTKPIGANCTNRNVEGIIANGSIFLEIDTSDVYMLKIVPSTSQGVTTYTGTWVKL